MRFQPVLEMMLLNERYRKYLLLEYTQIDCLFIAKDTIIAVQEAKMRDHPHCHEMLHLLFYHRPIRYMFDLHGDIFRKINRRRPDLVILIPAKILKMYGLVPQCLVDDDTTRMRTHDTEISIITQEGSSVIRHSPLFHQHVALHDRRRP